MANSLSLLHSYRNVKAASAEINAWQTLEQDGLALLQHKLLHIYGQLSGATTLYGFFAPHVSSQYVLQAKCYDAEGRLLKIFNGPQFSSKEAINRYARLTDCFSIWTKQPCRWQSKAGQKAKAALSAICNTLARQQKTALLHKITCTVFVSHGDHFVRLHAEDRFYP